jgi:energy-coupling factor transporter transmembrane protein EcfT
MIDVARIDHWAAHGAGPLHRSSVLAKLFFLSCVVGAAVAARDPKPLAAGYALLVALAVFSGLPWTSIGALSLYAAVFSLLYALSLHGDLWLYAMLVLKAVTPAYAVGMLIVSTPYPRVFAFLGAFLPETLAAGLFMTYRTFFILLDMMHNFGTAIRIRGGFTPGSVVRNGANIGRGIGALLIRAVERASRLYAVMTARGYNGSMAETSVGGITGHDWLPAGTGIVILIAVLVWR